MIIDARGLRHPEHLREFRRHFEGLCAVYEDITVYMDDSAEDLKKLEMYIRSCNANYKVHKEEGYLRIQIAEPFRICG
ncbi:MAG TPA: hypothetical protein DHV16_04335 [Nitrospiraceae bacterium]|nr:MAG: hypothetical protein A2Z82_04110 [Nitrospirae bacterium GWA2_46_11]OGW23723.1 MAG: hypothetical protein A2X55_12430 [Nitrospirae bacterium GWB2_47_37]HAK88041.1 hypothetical protein [Nitrospiraceae bacterium]HCL81853.1 hypothetical protein [Nitrospiraceae bacterium]HCZ11480.1 hypothetical protein [Nitrospiraceae bacterium]